MFSNPFLIFLSYIRLMIHAKFDSAMFHEKLNKKTYVLYLIKNITCLLVYLLHKKSTLPAYVTIFLPMSLFVFFYPARLLVSVRLLGR